MEEIIGWEVESVLEKGREHHNFISSGCAKIFTGGRTPLPHDVIREKGIRNDFANLAFIYNGCLK
jgi:hypothetical protein